MPPTIAISINTSWNIVNFRSGLIAALQREGFRVVALSPADPYSERLAALGVEHHPIAIDSKGVSPSRDLQLLFRYWRLLRRIRPAAFLGYTAKPNIYGSFAAQLAGVPVINNVSGLGTAFIQRSWITHVVTMLYRIAFRRSRVIFFQNRDDRDMFVASRILSEERTRLLPGSGIALDRYTAAPMPDPERPGPVFLLIARLLWDKGVGEFVEAARIVRRTLPYARFQLLGFLDVENRTAVGRGDVAAWQAEGLIDYLGATDDVRPAIAAADCVVLPSYREGLPRTLLEGAAMARPLIATDVPGCRDVARPGVSGLLCAVRDPASLAEAMLAFAILPNTERVAMGRRARALVEAEFDERIVVRRYLETVAEVTADRR